eukprot:5509632-Amphidinium_carterae.1
MSYTTTRTYQENQAHRHEILACTTTIQSDGELKIHKVSTENNPSDLMTKYLETAKVKKHSETIGLHPYIGNRSVNI